MIPFTSNKEYQSFRSWVLTGSCIYQRMASGSDGGTFKIPNHWLEKARLNVEWPPALLEGSPFHPSTKQ